MQRRERTSHHTCGYISFRYVRQFNGSSCGTPCQNRVNTSTGWSVIHLGLLGNIPAAIGASVRGPVYLRLDPPSRWLAYGPGLSLDRERRADERERHQAAPNCARGSSPHSHHMFAKLSKYALSPKAAETNSTDC
ncbi:unnamed protein product [Ectocarpus sp. 12 AP-2014]